MRLLPSKAFFRTALAYLGIVAVTLVLLDLVLIATGMFPPEYRYGHPRLGWVSASGPGGEFPCDDLAGGTTHMVAYNDDGHRSAWSAEELRGPGPRFEVAVSGDSHTDLCAPNELVHFGVLEKELERRGIPAATYSYGAGRYSPLQAWLAIEDGIRANQADAFVLNLYTGNDFYDMLRIDDRPHFVPEGDGYRIAEPVWYSFDDPEAAGDSRVLYLMGKAMEKSGVEAVRVRLSFLYDVARQQGEGLPAVVAYLNDIRQALAPELGYPAAFAAQLFNQQLFFHRFPGSAEESLKRVRALMRLIRERHPGLKLVMSPIPSYQLAHGGEADPAFEGVLSRLPLSGEESARMEREMYEALRQAADETGWLFVDTLAALENYRGSERLYNDFDYHITSPASALIGAAQAEVLAAAIADGEAGSAPTSLSAAPSVFSRTKTGSE